MIRLMSDSACDLPVSYVEAHGVELIRLYITFDGENYLKEGVELDREEFYDRMVNQGAFPKSSLPSVDDYYQAFEKAILAGDDVICISITTTLSGSFGSARTAASMILEEYPDAKIAVFDSLSNTASQAVVVEEMIRMRDDGLDFDTLVGKMPALLSTSRIIFTVGSLEYLRKGGRIGKLAVQAAGKLNLRPLLILADGKLGIGGVSRTRKKSIEDVLNNVKKFFEQPENKVEDYVFVVGYGYDKEEGEEFRHQLEEFLGMDLFSRKPGLPESIAIGPISATHTGPYALGVGLVKKYELV